MGSQWTPRVTIGLPVYNAGDLLAPMLESVISQTFEDFEFVISDNASTDGTSELCRELAATDSRVRYYRNPKNLGAAFNHNRLVGLARAEYFKWCGHDDVIEPAFVERCVDALDDDEEKRYVLCFTKLDHLDELGQISERVVQSPIFNGGSPSARLRNFWDSSRMHQVIYGVIRRSALESTGLLADWYGSDRHLLVELALLGGFTRVDEVLFHHREHANRSEYVTDKRAWMTATEGEGITLGYWRRLSYMWEILSRDYLSRDARIAIAAEYTRYAVKRAPHWVPQLGKELTEAATLKVRGLRNGPD